MPERQFQGAVSELLAWRHWVYFHAWNSIHSPAGFPDLIAVRRGRLVLAELKSARGRLTVEQERWATALAEVEEATGGIVTYRLWRPSDWTGGAIGEELA